MRLSQKSIGLPFLNNLKQKPKIILASGSPRRRELLAQMGITFEVMISSVYEDFSIDKTPNKFVEFYAEEKAKEISMKNSESVVIGADTVVVLNDNILGKPNSFDEAFSMLSNLSDSVHSVYTGVSIQWIQKSISNTFHSKTDVTIKPLSNDEIEYYIELYKPFDKAGSYGIQDWFSVCVKKIEGCYFNVMGLPLNRLYAELESTFNNLNFK